MERGNLRTGIINFALLVLAALAGYITARYAHTLAGEAACLYLGVGVLLAGLSLFQMRLEEQERIERMEFDELKRGEGSSRLFGDQSADALPARRSRELFEKYFVRGFTLALCLLQLAGAWWMWRRIGAASGEGIRQPWVAMSMFGMMALILFLFGKYAAGLAALQGQRLLRPSANFLLLGAYLLALSVLGIIGVQVDFHWADRVLAVGLTVILALLGVEMLLGMLLDLYRPRVRGQQAHLLYDSRLVGLLSRPEGLFTTAAHALDYQFGFKVSETWFYQFLQKALAWMILVQVGLLLLSTCVVFVDPGEEALLERFGRPVEGRDVLQAGLHVKWPWPIDQARRFQSQAIQSFNVGFEHEDEAGEDHEPVLWTVAHYKEEFHLIVASREQLSDTNNATGRKSPPVNLLSLAIPVQYQIRDVRAWAYGHENAGSLLEDLATREVVRYLVGVDMNEIMSIGRFTAGRELKDLIQQQADDKKLGVEILFVGLQDIHPPVRVAGSYERVVGARQNREADILAAKAHEVRTNRLARAEATRLKGEAEAESRRLEVSAYARAALFTNQIPAFTASPSVYAQRSYLQALAEGSAHIRKVIIATTNTDDVILLNLEERIDIGVLDAPLPEAGR